MKIIRKKNPEEAEEKGTYYSGKYISVVDEWLDATQVPVDSTGSVAEEGTYHALYHGPFVPEPTEISEYGLTPDDLSFINEHQAAVLTEDDQGFVDVSWYHTIEDADIVWDELTSSVEFDVEEYPEEDETEEEEEEE